MFSLKVPFLFLIKKLTDCLLYSLFFKSNTVACLKKKKSEPMMIYVEEEYFSRVLMISC